MKSRSNEVVALLADFFTEYLPNTKGLSTNTIKAYQYAFQLLFGFLDEEKKIPPDKVMFLTLSNGMIDEFLTHLETKRGCSVKDAQHPPRRDYYVRKIRREKSLSDSLPSTPKSLALTKRKNRKTNNQVLYQRGNPIASRLA